MPLQIGAPAIAFARGAAGAFWTWLVGIALVIVAYAANGGPGGGKADFVVLWTAALAMAIGGLAWALVIIATTILGARTTGMSLQGCPSPPGPASSSPNWVVRPATLLVELALTLRRVSHGFVPLEARSTLTGVTESMSLAPALFCSVSRCLASPPTPSASHTGRPVRAHEPGHLAAIGLLGVTSFGADSWLRQPPPGRLQQRRPLNVAILGCVLPVLAVLGLSGESLRRGTVRMTVALVGSLLAGLVLLLAAVVSLLGLIEPVSLFLHDKLSSSWPPLDKLLISTAPPITTVCGAWWWEPRRGCDRRLHHWSARRSGAVGWLSRSASPPYWLRPEAPSCGAWETSWPGSTTRPPCPPPRWWVART